MLDELRGPRANGPESIARRLARSLEAARERLSTEVARLGRATAAYRTADVAAAAVRTLALAAELATGPAGALVITATSEAAIAAIATYAVSRTLENIPSDERRYALVHVISRVEEEQLCDPMLAHVWRFAIGSRQGAPSSDWARAAVHVVTGAAVRRVARKRAVAQVLNVAVDLFFRAPEQARSAHRLVARARHHARAFADSL